MELQSNMARIQSQIFSLMANPQMRRCLLFSPSSQFSNSSIRLHVRHSISEISHIVEQQIVVEFPKEFPQKPPKICVIGNTQINVQIPQIIIKSTKIEEQNWKIDCSISEILTKLIQNLQLFWRSYYNFGHNMDAKQIKSFKFGLNPNIKQNLLKSPSSYTSPISQFKNERFILQRFQQVLQDLITQNNPQVTYYCTQIINLFQMNRYSASQVIKNLLSIDIFRAELKKQLTNGRWVNKILKSSAGVKSKKQMIKNSNQLLRQIIQIQIPTQQEIIQSNESDTPQ